MALHQSGEDYLEAILAIREARGHVRSVDVARHLSVTKPSVSRAMTLLRESGYIEMDDDNLISLTPAGQAVAEQIYERHQLLVRWLEELGVSPAVAAEDACRLEHAMSQETFSRLKEYIQKTEGEG